MRWITQLPQFKAKTADLEHLNFRGLKFLLPKAPEDFLLS